jgi:hypothetical protein
MDHVGFERPDLREQTGDRPWVSVPATNAKSGDWYRADVECRLLVQQRNDRGRHGIGHVGDEVGKHTLGATLQQGRD